MTLQSKELKIHATINTQNNRVKMVHPTIKSQSLVVPNMALSINQILERYSRGQSLPKTREPLYTDEDYSQLSRMNRLEKLDLLDETNHQINQTKQQLKQKQQDPPKQDQNGKKSEASEFTSDASDKGLKSLGDQKH